MTQFLLIETKRPYPGFSDLEFASVHRDCFLTESAVLLFPIPRFPSWTVSPPGDEAGALVYSAHDALRLGGSFKDSRLGQLLTTAVQRNDRFCLFYSADRSDLPAPATPDKLFAELVAQLGACEGSLELYVQWHGDAR